MSTKMNDSKQTVQSWSVLMTKVTEKKGYSKIIFVQAKTKKEAYEEATLLLSDLTGWNRTGVPKKYLSQPHPAIICGIIEDNF